VALRALQQAGRQRQQQQQR